MTNGYIDNIEEILEYCYKRICGICENDIIDNYELGMIQAYSDISSNIIRLNKLNNKGE